MRSDLLDQYLAYLSIEKGLRPKSLEAYRSDLVEFLTFLEKKGRTPFDQSIENQLVLFLVHLHQKGIGSRSLARKISSLRGFYKFLFKENIIQTDPTQIIEAPKIRRALPKVLSVEEIEKILAQPDLNTITGKRDRAILEVLYGAGLRESELINLQLEDFYQEGEFLRISGKGGRERIVPIGRYAIEALRTYIMTARPELVSNVTERTLFLNNRGKPFSRMGIWKIVKKYSLAAGIRRFVSPHVFRHSCATHMLEGGAGILAVQEMLGHADVSTTQIYTHLSNLELKKIHLEAHPRGKVK